VAWDCAVESGRTIDDAKLYAWLNGKIASADRPVVIDGYPRVPNALPHFGKLARQLARRGSVVALYLACTPNITAPRIITRARPDDRSVGFDRRNDEFDRVQLPLIGQLGGRVAVIEVDASSGPGDVVFAVRRRLGLAE